jgi:uncharacterized protein (DUF1800 family)
MVLLRGQNVAGGRTAAAELDVAMDNIFNDPNVGPFVARRLIQRLVTSNPSPAYVERVSAVFADDGAGRRGDMRAVITAILLDPDARARPTSGAIERGMLREPFLRRVHLARAFDAASPALDYRIGDGGAPVAFAQRPVSSPSVFNFFLPDHRPMGPIADAGLYGPEFQILTAVTAITGANALRGQIDHAMNNDQNPAFEVRLDLDDEIALAADVRALVDRLDLLLMHGTMSGAMREVLIGALERIGDLDTRARMAVHLISISPEYCVVQ